MNVRMDILIEMELGNVNHASTLADFVLFLDLIVLIALEPIEIPMIVLVVAYQGIMKLDRAVKDVHLPALSVETTQLIAYRADKGPIDLRQFLTAVVIPDTLWLVTKEIAKNVLHNVKLAMKI